MRTNMTWTADMNNQKKHTKNSMFGFACTDFGTGRFHAFGCKDHSHSPDRHKTG